MASRKRKQAKDEAAATEARETAQAAEIANAHLAEPALPDASRSPETEDRLTGAERQAMERFFGLGPRYPEWPVSALQRRMQSSRG